APRPALSPYTTLFRSLRRSGRQLVRPVVGELGVECARELEQAAARHHPVVLVAEAGRHADERAVGTVVEQASHEAVEGLVDRVRSEEHTSELQSREKL